MRLPTLNPIRLSIPALAPTLFLAYASCAAANHEPGEPSATNAVSGVLLVANQQSGTATIVDLESGATAHLPVGAGPHEAAISPDGRLGVVTIYGGQGGPGNQLAVIDMSRRTVARTIDLGEYRRPHDVVFIPGSSTRIAVTSEVAQRVVLVDIAAGTIVGDVETRAQGSHMVALAADGRTAFTANVGSGSVSQIDLSTRAFVRSISTGPQTEGIAITPDGREVWAGSNQAGRISIVEVSSGRIAAAIPDLGVPYRITISPDGKTAVIPDPGGDRVHIADVASRRVVGQITGLTAPRGAEVAADNRTAFVTLAPGEVVVVDLVTRTVLARHKVENAPDGVAWGPKPPDDG